MASEASAGALRPRAARRPRNDPKGPRGLPDASIIRDLAVMYLREQRRHWPRPAQLGVLPDPADGVAVAAMAAAFRDRHTAGALPDLDPSMLRHAPRLAACYSRYSCDNSSRASIADQREGR